MRVAILPTGQTEWHGLSQAFGRLFPDHDFYCLPKKSVLQSDKNLLHGFTSARLTRTHIDNPPVNAKDLVKRAALEAVRDRHNRDAADLVLIIDDVELHNMNQVDLVVDVMRGEVKSHWDFVNETRDPSSTKIALQERVSFHLASPMIESWFFADPNALTVAGVPAGATVCFDPMTDPENFITHDAMYLAATEDECPTFTALASDKKKKMHRPIWLGDTMRQQHPKGYLQWLCRAPSEDNCTTYKESTSGSNALAGISWQEVFGRDAAHFCFLRALVEDLVDGLGCAPAVPVGSPTNSVPTSRFSNARDKVLRNI